jgi:hypothetical protein
MAFANIDSQTLGKFLQIVFSDGVRVQISEDFRDWEMVTRLKTSESSPRELRFLLQTDFGAQAIQWRNPGAGGTFPSAQQVSTSEKSAKFHELFATIELEHNLWTRAMKTPEKYAEPLAVEIQSKNIACKRRLSGDFHLDGSGTLGKVSAVAAPASNQVTITFDSSNDVVGGERFFEWGDAIEFWTADGSTKRSSTGLTILKVVDKDRTNNTVTFADPAGGALTATDIVATDYAYRANGASSQPDQATGFVGVEMGTLTEVMAGLETLFATDGRKIHDITMSGATKGTKYGAGGQALDITHIQAALDKVKTVVGQSTYRYPQMLMAPESNATLIDSNETDRRLISITDSKRGTKGFGYVHNNDTLEVMTSEYCHAKRVWMLPQGGKESGVIELHGTDFSDVQVGSQSEFLRPSASSAGHDGFIRKYMFGMATLISKHPAAGCYIDNFTV